MVASFFVLGGMQLQRKYLTEYEVARLTGRALSTLRNDRVNGRGFPFIRWGRFIRYNRSDVISFMESRKIATVDSAEGCNG